MQNKGKLAALLSSVIAVLLILVCAFYLSFTIVNSNYETAATDYAHVQSQGKENQDQAYNDAYKHYMDSIGQQKVYLGYTLDEVRKWGVNLGLDLKGGMNVTLQVDMPDMMRQLANVKNDSNFEKALTATSAFMDKEPNADYLQHFLAEYAKVCPNADLISILFSPHSSFQPCSQRKQAGRGTLATTRRNTRHGQHLGHANPAQAYRPVRRCIAQHPST